MNPRKGLVLDANILLRAIFGTRVRQLLEAYEDVAAFYSPDACFAEAQKYIPDLAKRRGLDSKLAVSLLGQVSRIVELVDKSLYQSHEKLACERIARRDPRDWPVVAVALLLGIPVWQRIRISLGAASLRAPRTESRYTCENPRKSG